MRILACGDRHWHDKKRIKEVLSHWHWEEGDILVHGACEGADIIANAAAIELDILTEAHPADWSKYGKAAGPIRNKEMLKSGLDMVIAFHNDLNSSRGTRDMIKQALKAKIPVMLATDHDYYEIKEI